MLIPHWTEQKKHPPLFFSVLLKTLRAVASVAAALSLYERTTTQNIFTPKTPPFSVLSLFPRLWSWSRIDNVPPFLSVGRPGIGSFLIQAVVVVGRSLRHVPNVSRGAGAEFLVAGCDTELWVKAEVLGGVEQCLD